MLPLDPKPGVSALHAASVEKDTLLPSPNTIPSDAEIHTQKLSSICAHSVATVHQITIHRAATPSLDTSIMKSDFKCSNWIFSVMHMLW